jgi:hypothetical protein
MLTAPPASYSAGPSSSSVFSRRHVEPEFSDDDSDVFAAAASGARDPRPAHPEARGTPTVIQSKEDEQREERGEGEERGRRSVEVNVDGDSSECDEEEDDQPLDLRPNHQTGPINYSFSETKVELGKRKLSYEVPVFPGSNDDDDDGERSRSTSPMPLLHKMHITERRGEEEQDESEEEDEGPQDLSRTGKNGDSMTPIEPEVSLRPSGGECDNYGPRNASKTPRFLKILKF